MQIHVNHCKSRKSESFVCTESGTALEMFFFFKDSRIRFPAWIQQLSPIQWFTHWRTNKQGGLIWTPKVSKSQFILYMEKATRFPTQPLSAVWFIHFRLWVIFVTQVNGIWPSVFFPKHLLLTGFISDFHISPAWHQVMPQMPPSQRHAGGDNAGAQGGHSRETAVVRGPWSRSVRWRHGPQGEGIWRGRKQCPVHGRHGWKERSLKVSRRIDICNSNILYVYQT